MSEGVAGPKENLQRACTPPRPYFVIMRRNQDRTSEKVALAGA